MDGSVDITEDFKHINKAPEKEVTKPSIPEEVKLMITEQEYNVFLMLLTEGRINSAKTRDGNLAFIVFEDKLKKIIEPHVSMPNQAHK